MCLLAFVKEDAVLVDCVKTRGAKNWAYIAAQIAKKTKAETTRNAKSCRLRWGDLHKCAVRLDVSQHARNCHTGHYGRLCFSAPCTRPLVSVKCFPCEGSWDY